MSNFEDLNRHPDGWAVTKLGEVCEVMDVDHKMPKAVAQGVLFISPKDFTESETINFEDAKQISEEEFQRLSRKCKPEPGDILYSRIGTIGKVRKVPSNIKFHISYSLCIIRPHVLFEGDDYFFWLLKSPQVLNQALEKRRSIGVPDLGLGDIRNFDIPIPPLAEQRCVVAKLEEFVTKLDAGVEALRTARVQLKRYRQSVLKAAVMGELTKEWREAHRGELEPASELLARILRERREKWEADQLAKMKAAGKTPKNDEWNKKYAEPTAPDLSNLPDLPEGWTWASTEQVGEVGGGLTKNQKRDKLSLKMPYLRVANVYAGELDLSEIKEIGVEASEIERVLLSAGDLLVVEGNGSIDQVGRVALWDGRITPCLHQNHLIKVRFTPTQMSEYVLLWLLSKEGRDFITKVASSTSGLHTLSLSKVSGLPIPLTSLAEQQQIVAEVERLLSIADATERAIGESLKQAERLRQSILKRAFEGKLVPQDPADESAEVLLERIRVERAKSADGKSKKGMPRGGRKQGGEQFELLKGAAS